MHILIFSDQHVQSLGGAQVSIRLQQRFLRALGHEVTIVAPKLHRRHESDPDYVDVPSMPVTIDREYGMMWPSGMTDRWIDRALATRPPVDLVHVQADQWGATIGYRYIARHGLPAVHTFHNNMEHGIEQVVPMLARPVIAVLGLWQRILLRPRRSRMKVDTWGYFNEFALRADAVIAPSGHFSRLLTQKGVADEIDVILTGADDAVIDGVLTGGRTAGESRRPRLIWVGRMSHEKRLMEYLEAISRTTVDAEFRIYGTGMLYGKAQAFVREHGLGDRVVFAGQVPYPEALAAIADADALVQTSIGFETQGMTVFEAAALGTPTIISDPNIAGELPDDLFWQTRDGSVDALAEILTEVAGTIVAGENLVVAPQESAEFRQSHQTEKIVAVYERVLAGR